MGSRSSGNRFPDFRSMRVIPSFAGPSLAVRSLAALLAAALAGCIADGDKHAGVDEFPNSVYARVSGFLDEGKKSEEIATPPLGDSLRTGTGFIVAAAKTAGPAARKLAAAQEQARFAAAPLAKAYAGCAGVTFAWTDSIGNLPPPKLYTKDTLTACLDAKATDSIAGNETILRGKNVTVFATGRVETVEISDADGDGILNPVAGGGSKATLVVTATEKGITERTALMTGPGPDGDFSTEADNLVYTLSWSRARGTDTLALASYADADGDGIAVDNGNPSLVDMELYQAGPSEDHPDALWSRASIRMTVRYHVDSKEVRRVRFEMEDGAHRVTVAEVLARDGAADFGMRDTVIAHFSTIGAASPDPLDTLDVRLTMRLGGDFDSPTDDTVYAIRVKAAYKIGEEAGAEFGFVSSEPIASGAQPRNGTLTMTLAYRDGTGLKVDGVLKAGGMDVIIVDREGKRANAVWDGAGRGVIYKRLTGAGR
jgi:hypothetical protein